MPADAGIDERDAGALQLAEQPLRVFEGVAAGDEIEAGHAEHDDEVRPDRGTHPTHDFEREATAVLERAAPLVLRGDWCAAR